MTTKPKLLLVDDNQIVLTGMKLMMESIGIEPKMVMDTKTAMDAIKKEVFDLMITDIELPDGSGCSLSKSVRNLEREQGRKPSKIIGLTGYAVSEVITSCKEAGMDEVYQKPMHVSILRTLIAKAEAKVRDERKNLR